MAYFVYDIIPFLKLTSVKLTDFANIFPYGKKTLELPPASNKRDPKERDYDILWQAIKAERGASHKNDLDTTGTKLLVVYRSTHSS